MYVSVSLNRYGFSRLFTVVTLFWVAWVILGALVTKPRVRLEFTKERGKEGPLLMGRLNEARLIAV